MRGEGNVGRRAFAPVQSWKDLPILIAFGDSASLFQLLEFLRL